jgi:bifunctional non-homologous end joining protein LigD
MADDPLFDYRRKRDQGRTPEPFAARPPRRSGPQSSGVFVVQQHAARRMHWDLRLEIGGVLASWAVPKGPTFDPREKRLAVRTEDHPIEYADFEGIIPVGNYGAGAMIVWDAGIYRTSNDTDAASDVEGGKLEVEFSGHKLRGRWALVRIKGEDGKNWLLLSKQSALPSAPELVVARPASILSGLTIEELRDGADRTAALAERARAAGATAFDARKFDLSPMLAETASAPFSRDDWIFELKHDGIRMLGMRDADGSTRLRSRSGREISALFPEIANAIRHLPCAQFVVDGEIVALDERGIASFEMLQRRLAQADAAAIAVARRSVPVLAFCFDLIAVAGFDLRRLPLMERKEMLGQLLPAQGVLRYTDHIEGEGEAFFHAARDAGLEGIVGKRARSVYSSGRRSRDWLKVPVQREADLAVVGYLRGQGSRQRLGSLMLACSDAGELTYAGNVGSGLSGAIIDKLLPLLERTQRATPAFRGEAVGAADARLYVEPTLVARVRYAQVTAAGVLRQPRLLGLRDDKAIADCDRLRREVELPEAPAPPEPQLQVSNRDKVFWPRDGYTKGDLLQYYETIWPQIAPYLRDRPVVLTRYPDGIDGKNFFQKNAPDFTPDWVRTFRSDDTDYFVCNDVQTLLYVINSGCIPLHVWSSRCATIEHPDWAILDLDPKGAPFVSVVTLARSIHALLDTLRVPHGVKTSGQDGLHVLIPLGGELTHAQARSFAEVLARVVAAQHPDIATVARPVGERGGKVYIDFLQNGHGKTIVAPYSVRPRDGAPVSTPLQWREVNERLRPAQFSIVTAPRRFQRRADPLLSILAAKADVPRALQKLAASL